MARAVGIDLGTTYTVVAVIEKDKPKIIPNAEGQPLTPSVVAFTEEGRPLVGQLARRQAAANPERTVFSIKRRMGEVITAENIKEVYGADSCVYAHPLNRLPAVLISANNSQAVDLRKVTERNVV